jgi:uncharacterized repeat protein (TIGR01451 family)
MKSILFITTFFSSLFTFGQFGLPYELASPLDSPSEFCVADFDGDIDNDIVVTAFSDSRIVLYTQLTPGVFGAQQIITNSVINPNTIDFADLDGDLDKDLVAAGSGNGNIFLIRNNGNSWNAIVIHTGSVSATKVRCHDVDGDTDEDILFILANELWLIENNGNGFNTAQLVTVIPSPATELLIEDMDGDSDADVIIGTQSGDQIYLLTNDGFQVFNQSLISNTVNNLQFINVGDIDLDGDLDILSAANNDNQLSWFENLGAGNFGGEIVICTTPNAKYISISDIDNDLDMDVVAGAGPWNLCWVENIGGTTFSLLTPITAPNNITEALFIDLDGDSKGDFVFTQIDDQLLWVKNLNVGSFSSPIKLMTTVTFCRSFDLGDIDNDGDLDAVASSYELNQITLYNNVAIDSFERQILLATLPGVIAIKFCEVNDDSLIDIVCVSTTSGLYWLENLGGTFSAPQLISGATGGPEELECADLDNDGDEDLVVGYYNSDKIVWFERTGSAVFAPAQTITTQSDVIVNLRIGDINVDGYRDVFSVSYGDQKVAWYENLGNGTFGPQVDLSTFYSPVTGAIGDLDMDGDMDVIYASSNSILFFIENLGNGLFGPEQIINVAFSNYSDLFIKDINDDGVNDIVVTTNSFTFLLQKTSSLNYTVDTIPCYTGVTFFLDIEAVDLDLDGDLEIFLGGDALSLYSNPGFYMSQLNGSVFFDQNLNGIFDTGESGIPAVSLHSNPISDYTFTNQDGLFSMYFSDIIGNYQLGIDSIPYWSLVTDSLVYNFTINSTNQLYTNLFFGFAPDSLVNEITLDLTGSPTQCNDTLTFWITIENTGTSNPTGVIEVNLDPSITYIGSSFPEDSIIGQNIYWNYSNLPYFNDTLIVFQALAPDFNFMGDTLVSYLNVTIDSSGNLMGVFNSSHSDILTCAYDPNDKTGVPWGTGVEGLINSNTEYIDYTIRFQNTGNDTAQVIKIIDQLDVNLDFSSVQLLATSHSVYISVNQSGIIEFLFDNIMLPDSSVNQSMSHGFVKFRVPIIENTPIGTQIHNFASIFFDENPAVVTNTEVHTLYLCSQILAEINYPSVLCNVQEISLSINDNLNTTNYTWEVPGETLQDSNVFSWSPTTFGQYVLNVSASHPGCSADTTVFFEILPQLPPTYLDTIHICQGDSALIFNQYQYISSAHSDTLFSSLGCDSVLVQTLIVHEYFNLFLTSFNPDTICVESGLIPLPMVSPTGGYFAGQGVIDLNFNPQLAGVGLHTITYLFTDIYGCSDSDSTNVVVEECLSLFSQSENTVIVYPNPIDEIVYIESNLNIEKIQIFDMSNRIVLQREGNHNKGIHEFNISSLTSGIYMLWIATPNGFKIIKIKKN